MKRYAINVPALKTNFIITLPDLSLSKNRKLGALGNLIEWLFYITVPLMFVVLPFYKFNSVSWEQSVMSFIVLFLGFLLFLYVGKIVLFGKTELKDPLFFMSVILYTLFSTTASVFALPANVANTFGSKDLKIVSGLAVFLFLLLFYFVRNYIINSNRLKILLRFLFLGFSMYLLALIFVTNKVSLSAELPALVIYSAFFFILILNSGRLKLFRTLLLIGLLSFVFVQLYTFKNFSIALGDILIPLFLSTLTLDFVIYKTNPNVIKSYIKELKASFKQIKVKKQVTNLRLFLRNLFVGLIFASPALILLLILGMLASSTYQVSRITSDFNSIINSFNYLFSESSKNFLTVFMGTGFKGAIGDTSLLSNIIRIQGLIGFITYIVFGSFAVINLTKALKANLYNNKVLYAIAFVIISVPIFSLFVYPTIFVSILWWVCFASLSFIMAPNSVKETLDKRIFPLTIFGRFNNIYGLLLKLILIVTFAILLFLITSSFLKVIG